jgi:hypothetical protein
MIRERIKIRKIGDGEIIEKDEEEDCGGMGKEGKYWWVGFLSFFTGVCYTFGKVFGLNYALWVFLWFAVESVALFLGRAWVISEIDKNLKNLSGSLTLFKRQKKEIEFFELFYQLANTCCKIISQLAPTSDDLTEKDFITYTNKLKYYSHIYVYSSCIGLYKSIRLLLSLMQFNQLLASRLYECKIRATKKPLAYSELLHIKSCIINALHERRQNSDNSTNLRLLSGYLNRLMFSFHEMPCKTVSEEKTESTLYLAEECEEREENEQYYIIEGRGEQNFKRSEEAPVLPVRTDSHKILLEELCSALKIEPSVYKKEVVERSSVNQVSQNLMDEFKRSFCLPK